MFATGERVGATKDMIAAQSIVGKTAWIGVKVGATNALQCVRPARGFIMAIGDIGQRAPQRLQSTMIREAITIIATDRNVRVCVSSFVRVEFKYSNMRRMPDL